MLCSSCGGENPAENRFCAHCGSKLGAEVSQPREKAESSLADARAVSRKASAVGIAGLILAVFGLLLPVILVSLLAPLVIILASIELSKGSKAVGGTAMALGLVQLLLVASTFQSCSRKLGGEQVAAIPWEGNLRLNWGHIERSYSGSYDRWEGEVENVGNKTIKTAKVYIARFDLNGRKIQEEWTYVVAADRFGPGQIKRVDKYLDRPVTVELSDRYQYWFVIEDYE